MVHYQKTVIRNHQIVIAKADRLKAGGFNLIYGNKLITCNHNNTSSQIPDIGINSGSQQLITSKDVTNQIENNQCLMVTTSPTVISDSQDLDDDFKEHKTKYPPDMREEWSKKINIGPTAESLARDAEKKETERAERRRKIEENKQEKLGPKKDYRTEQT